MTHAFELATLDALSARPDRPKAMAAFERYYREGVRAAELASGAAPVVGQFCQFVPDEIIIAAGAVPVRLDLGCRAAAEAGERITQAETCCAVQAATGACLEAQWPLQAAADLIVVPTSCDGKKKLAERLSATREVFALQLPYGRGDERARLAWHDEMARFVKRLEQFTGRRVTSKALAEAIALVNQRTTLFRRLQRARQQPCLPIRGTDALLVMQTSFGADLRWWLAQTSALLDELDARVAAGIGHRPRARLLLTGSPVLWPDFKLPLLIDATGADLVADELCSGSQRLANPTVVDEPTLPGMLRAAAEKSLLPCTCPCFAEGDARVDRLHELIEQQRVDGIVHHTLRLCQLYDLDAAPLAAHFAGQGVGWLAVRTDLSSEDGARLDNRLAAFVEMLEQQRLATPSG